MDLLGALLIAGIALYLLQPDLFANILPADGQPSNLPNVPAMPDGQTSSLPNVPTSGQLTPVQIAALATNAGFAGNDLVTAVAIAYAESSGIPSKTGKLGEIGLWQIYPTMHPEFGPDFSALYDPATNAHAAYSVYSVAGMTFRPWSTWPTLYLKYVPMVQTALGG